MYQLWILFCEEGFEEQIAMSRVWYAERRGMRILTGVTELTDGDCTRG